jgi:hypothetical protein
MSDIEHGLIKDRTLEELIDALARVEAEPFSGPGVAIQAAIQARLAERLATPRKWAAISMAAAALSAAGTVTTAIVAL